MKGGNTFGGLARFLHRIHISWEDDNMSKCVSLCEADGGAALLDCGCSWGGNSLQVARAIKTNAIYGIDLKEERCQEAKTQGVEPVLADLNQGIPFRDGVFDIVFSNQVIEHLAKIDTFVKEVRRVLKAGGYCIVATENLSSWDNIFALVLGWRPFSADLSDACYIGNPLAPGYKGTTLPHHLRIPTYRSFKELFELYDFSVEKMVGAGYPPLSGKVSSLFSRLDPRHARFIITKARKGRNTGLGR